MQLAAFVETGRDHPPPQPPAAQPGGWGPVVFDSRRLSRGAIQAETGSATAPVPVRHESGGHVGPISHHL